MAKRAKAASVRWHAWRNRVFRDPEVRRAYEALEPEFALARFLIELRARRNLSQRAFARLAGVKQPVLSRIEGATDIPTIFTLAKLVNAAGAELEIRAVDEAGRRLRGVKPVRIPAPHKHSA